MNEKSETISELLCLSCKEEPSDFLFTKDMITCRKCGYTYSIINDIPACFHQEDKGFVDFSEIDIKDRRNFLKMKQMTYLKKSFLQRLYVHYHLFAANQRLRKENPTTLDIGFGMGEHSAFIDDREIKERRFIGLDIDRFKLEFAKKNAPDLLILQGNAFRLPFTSQSFDVVQLLGILEHFSPPEIYRLLEEVKRVLRKEGMVIVGYPADGSILLSLGQKMVHFFLNTKTGFNLDESEHHDHKVIASELRQILGQNFKRNLKLYYPFRIPSINLNLFVNETYIHQ